MNRNEAIDKEGARHYDLLAQSVETLIINKKLHADKQTLEISKHVLDVAYQAARNYFDEHIIFDAYKKGKENAEAYLEEIKQAFP